MTIKDIRITNEFIEFIKWEYNTNIVHFKTENFGRNIQIFISYLEGAQKLSKKSLQKIGIEYSITKERVRQIYTKYLIHFILYLHYVYGYNLSNELFNYTIHLLNTKQFYMLKQHLIDKKPFKGITRQDLTMFIHNKK